MREATAVAGTEPRNELVTMKQELSSTRDHAGSLANELKEVTWRKEEVEGSLRGLMERQKALTE
eukprot:13012459-Ditylum_brightwellii.AAC.1